MWTPREPKAAQDLSGARAALTVSVGPLPASHQSLTKVLRQQMFSVGGRGQIALGSSLLRVPCEVENKAPWASRLEEQSAAYCICIEPPEKVCTRLREISARLCLGPAWQNRHTFFGGPVCTVLWVCESCHNISVDKEIQLRLFVRRFKYLCMCK